MMIRLVNQNYYIRIGQKFKKVKGMAVEIPSFPNFDLFLHADKGGLSISEGRSGTKLSVTHKSKKSAITFVEKLIEKKGEGIIEMQIKKQIGRYLLSPRYRFIVNPTRQNVATK